MIQLPKTLDGKLNIVDGEYVLYSEATQAEQKEFAKFIKAMADGEDRKVTCINGDSMDNGL